MVRMLELVKFIRDRKNSLALHYDLNKKRVDLLNEILAYAESGELEREDVTPTKEWEGTTQEIKTTKKEKKQKKDELETIEKTEE